MPDGPIRFLIVGHDVEGRQLLRRLIAVGRWGRRNQPVFFEAPTGAEGYERCLRELPHCILIDYRLADLAAVEFIKRLPRRGLTDSGFPIVIMLTDSDDEAEATRVMRYGVHEVVIKDEMTAQSLDEVIRRAVSVVRRRQRVEAKTRRLSQARAQLHAAGEVQRRMLPVAAPRVPGFDLAGVCQPAEETGGDFFDYVRFGDGSLGVVIGDVSGHGLGPALLAADCSAYLRAACQTKSSPGQVLVHSNNLLCRDTNGESFVTVFLIQVTPHSPLVRFAAAGQPGLILRRSGAMRVLYSQQPPLGIARDLGIGVEDKVLMQPGDLLVLTTDGVIEAASSEEGHPSFATMFGVERTLEVVGKHRLRSAAKIVEALLRSVRQFTKSRVQDDDMTAVVVKAESAGLIPVSLLPRSLQFASLAMG